jgi:hypothetical protein
MKASQRLDEIKAELERAGLDLPGILRALGPSISIGEFLKIKFAADTVTAILAEEYDKKFPKKHSGRIETRAVLSESLR